MSRVLWIALAGAGGALTRYALSLWIGDALMRRGTGFPLATMLINIAGAFLLSVLVTLVAHRAVPSECRIVLGTGFLGAFTTYSTFAVEADELLTRGAWNHAVLYIGGNLFGGALAVVLGRFLMLRLVG